MNLKSLNTTLVSTRNWYKGLFLLGLVFCLGMANAATYYLTSAGRGNAQTVTNWNTNPAGGGSTRASWTTGSTNDIFIVPTGIVGTWNTATPIDIGSTNANAQSYTFVINGSLNIIDNGELNFRGNGNRVTFTINGTLTISDDGGDEAFKTTTMPTGSAYFRFLSGATLICNNPNGISGLANSVFGTNTDFVFLHDPGANYSFINTANATTTNGLNDTLNKLTISTTGRICKLVGNTVVRDTLKLNTGTLDVLAFTLTCSGAIIRTSGSIHFTAGSGTVVFTNTVARTIPSNAFLRYPANFTMNGVGGITLGGNNRTAATDSLETITMTSGNLTLTSGITAIGSITGSGGNIVGNATATLVFYGATTNTLLMSQTSPGTTNAVNVLTLNGASNVTLGSNLNVNTTINLNARTLNLSSFTLTKTGGIDLATGLINMSSGTLSVSGTLSRTTGVIHGGTGTIIFTNGSAVTLPSNTFIDYPSAFTLNGAGGVTLGSNTRPEATDSLGALTMTSGNLTLTSGTTAIDSITGSGGNIVGNATATLVFYGSSTNTLLMNQTTPGTSNAVNNLTLNGTSNVTLGANMDVKGTLTINGRTLNLGSFTFTKTGGIDLATGVVNMSSGTLSLSGTITRTTGVIHGGTGTIIFTNVSAVTLPSNTFIDYPSAFTLNGAGGVILGGKTGTLKDSLGNLTFTSGNLTVTTDTTCIGSITGSGGSIVGNTSSTVRFYGNGTSTFRTVQTTPGTSNAVKNLLLTGSSNVTLGTATRIAADGLVNIPSSTTLNTGGLLTIVSNASGHGRVGTVGGTFTSSSTDSIQLFIPGGQRGYRLFGNPFTSALAISQFMDNATEIDVTGAGGSGNGFTNTLNNNPSAYSYNTSGNSWDAFTSTSQTIGIGAGAHILVRGVKGEGLDGAAYTPSASTIRLSGQLSTGTVVTSLSDAGFGWNLVSNPYPSNIDIDQISGGNWVNVNAAIYGYDKVNKTYSAYSKNVGNAVNNLSNIIEMGSSFLAEVTTTGSASITFTEAIKTSASSTVSGNPIFTPKAGRLNQFKINLIGAEASEGIFQDECLLSFGNTSVGTPEFDAQSDAWDLGGEMLNVSIITPKNDYLAINEYPSIEKQTEAIPLNVWSKNNGEYTLSFTEVSPINENTQIWLRDKYKGEVHFIQESPYTFAINDMEESYGANRFELFTVQQSSGLSKTSPKNTMSLFPNPMNVSSNKVSIFIPGEGHEYAKVTMYDLSGRVIYVGKQTKYETNQVKDSDMNV